MADRRETWRARREAFLLEAKLLRRAASDPRVPWYAKALVAAALAYALSPIDLIPDFIPVLGYLDDLLLVPAAVLLARRLIPADVAAALRAEIKAQE